MKNVDSFKNIMFNRNFEIYSVFRKFLRKICGSCFHYFTLLYQLFSLNDRWTHRVFVYRDDFYKYYSLVLPSSEIHKSNVCLISAKTTYWVLFSINWISWGVRVFKSFGSLILVFLIAFFVYILHGKIFKSNKSS